MSRTESLAEDQACVKRIRMGHKLGTTGRAMLLRRGVQQVDTERQVLSWLTAVGCS